MVAQNHLTPPKALLDEVRQLRDEVEGEAKKTFDAWKPKILREDFLPSALNLAHYLALRREDRCDVQQRLLQWGLSSLGRSESRVMPNLQAVVAALAHILGEGDGEEFPKPEGFMRGVIALEANADDLFGQSSHGRRVRTMVTMPGEAAANPGLVNDLMKEGMDCARINCAHDGPEEWSKISDYVRAESRRLGRSCSVLMDLSGPKARVGQVFHSSHEPQKLHAGDSLRLVRESQTSSDPDSPYAECLLTEAIDQLAVGAQVWIDDGKIGCWVVGRTIDELHLQVFHAPQKGGKLAPDKGLNFPGSSLDVRPLTEKDLADLDFVAQHADLVGYSFVQSGEDVDALLLELEKRGDQELGIVAKIETQRAVHNLPEIIVRAAGRRRLGVMIARGDLAVEIGWQRISEMQEEIMWICEAAHVPVIWATQVLENLVKKGSPSRAEITDAAMSERAECVMLNKGPFVREGLAMLDNVLRRMQEHQWKKMPKLRALRSWNRN